MNTFKIIKEILVEDENIELLNRKFKDRVKDENFYRTCTRMSSYHDPVIRKVIWPKYNMLTKGSIVVVSSDKEFSSEEALEFMKKSGGFSMTRDNLFMTWALFQHHLQNNENIVAVMNADLLPKHLNAESAICPALRIIGSGNPSYAVEYEWYWFDWTNLGNTRSSHHGSFVFFKPLQSFSPKVWF